MFNNECSTTIESTAVQKKKTNPRWAHTIKLQFSLSAHSGQIEIELNVIACQAQSIWFVYIRILLSNQIDTDIIGGGSIGCMCVCVCVSLLGIYVVCSWDLWLDMLIPKWVRQATDNG